MARPSMILILHTLTFLLFFLMIVLVKRVFKATADYTLGLQAKRAFFNDCVCLTTGKSASPPLFFLLFFILLAMMTTGFYSMAALRNCA